MGTLRLTAATPSADEIYQRLVQMHEGCDAGESERRNARLILLLANHIADPEVVSEAIRIAQRPDHPG